MIGDSDKFRSASQPLQTTPFQHLTVDQQGNFSNFCPELMAAKDEEFVFGNVKDGLITNSLMNVKVRKAFSGIVEGVKTCKASCAYFDVCYGGSHSNKYYENGTFDSTVTVDCTYSKMLLTDVILEKLEASTDLKQYLK